MTHFMIDNEGDLELGIDYATKLAMEKGDNKLLEFTFPSQMMMKIFANNLFRTWLIEKVPKDNNLELILNIPDDDDHVTRS